MSCFWDTNGQSHNGESHHLEPVSKCAAWGLFFVPWNCSVHLWRYIWSTIAFVNFCSISYHLFHGELFNKVMKDHFSWLKCVPISNFKGLLQVCESFFSESLQNYDKWKNTRHIKHTGNCQLLSYKKQSNQFGRTKGIRWTKTKHQTPGHFSSVASPIDPSGIYPQVKLCRFAIFSCPRPDLTCHK